MNYGLPYMGSKNKIAEWVLSYLPKAENLYDLFCGGCAITHCAMIHNKYQNYIINDIKGIMPQLFVDCLKGKYKDEKRWISREDFFKLKDTDGYVHTCFSFGNKGQNYLYGERREQIKKAMHYALCFEDFSLLENFGIDAKGILNCNQKKRYQALKNIVKGYIGRCDLQNIEALNRLQNIEAMGNVLNFNKSYDDIEIKPNSVIYCDIPYRNTATYNEETFDYNKFYEWALSQTEPVFISEYDMPSDFICIAERDKNSTLSATNNSLKTTERIFVPKHQYKENKPKVEQLNIF